MSQLGVSCLFGFSHALLSVWRGGRCTDVAAVTVNRSLSTSHSAPHPHTSNQFTLAAQRSLLHNLRANSPFPIRKLFLLTLLINQLIQFSTIPCAQLLAPDTHILTLTVVTFQPVQSPFGECLLLRYRSVLLDTSLCEQSNFFPPRTDLRQS